MGAEADGSVRSVRRKPPAARLLLYSHDSYGLGHFRRNLSIAEAVAADMPNVSTLLLTGSPRSHSFPLPPRNPIAVLRTHRVQGLQHHQRQRPLPDFGFSAHIGFPDEYRRVHVGKQ